MKAIPYLKVMVLVVAVLRPDIGACTVIVVPSPQFPTVQSALTSASTGDTVLVQPGTYSGPGNTNLTYGGKGIVLISAEGPGVTVLDCGGGGRAVRFGTGDGSDAILSGFTITHAGNDAVFCTQNCRPIIRDCAFVDNGTSPEGSAGILAMSGGAAIVSDCTWLGNSGSACYLSNATGVQLSGCQFQGNTTEYYGGAIYCENADAMVDRCLITGNVAQLGGAIYVFGAGLVSIQACTIAGNLSTDFGGGMFLDAGASPVLTRSIVWGNCAGIGGDEAYLVPTDWVPQVTFECSDVDSSGVVAGFPGWGIHYEGTNLFEDPEFCEAMSCEVAPFGGGDYNIHSDSPCTAANSPCGQQIGVGDPDCIVSDAVASSALQSGRVQVWPNPMSTKCVVFGSGLQAPMTRIDVVNSDGRRVRRLLGLPSGELGAVWDRRDGAGQSVPRGMYFIQCQGPGWSRAARVVVVSDGQ